MHRGVHGFWSAANVPVDEVEWRGDLHWPNSHWQSYVLVCAAAVASLLVDYTCLLSPLCACGVFTCALERAGVVALGVCLTLGLSFSSSILSMGSCF